MVKVIKTGMLRGKKYKVLKFGARTRISTLKKYGELSMGGFHKKGRNYTKLVWSK